MLLWPRPPQVCMLTPMPRLMWPEVLSPRGCQFFCQSTELGGLLKFFPVDFPASRRKVRVLGEKLDGVHVELGGQIFQRAHGQRRGLRMIRRAPSAGGSGVRADGGMPGGACWVFRST